METPQRWLTIRKRYCNNPCLLYQIVRSIDRVMPWRMLISTFLLLVSLDKWQSHRPIFRIQSNYVLSKMSGSLAIQRASHCARRIHDVVPWFGVSTLFLWSHNGHYGRMFTLGKILYYFNIHYKGPNINVDRSTQASFRFFVYKVLVDYEKEFKNDSICMKCTMFICLIKTLPL